jgi:hypothetical protein
MSVEKFLNPKVNILEMNDDGYGEASIYDAELDPVNCKFVTEGCVILDTSSLDYVELTELNLRTLLNLIRKHKAEIKKLEDG